MKNTHVTVEATGFDNFTWAGPASRAGKTVACTVTARHAGHDCQCVPAAARVVHRTASVESESRIHCVYGSALQASRRIRADTGAGSFFVQKIGTDQSVIYHQSFNCEHNLDFP